MEEKKKIKLQNDIENRYSEGFLPYVVAFVFANGFLWYFFACRYIKKEKWDVSMARLKKKGVNAMLGINLLTILNYLMLYIILMVIF